MIFCICKTQKCKKEKDNGIPQNHCAGQWRMGMWGMYMG